MVVVHPPYRWQQEYRRWITEDLRHVSEESGIIVAVENMFPLRLPGAPSMAFHSEHARADRDGTPYLVLDTSHAAVAGLDIRQALARDHDRIRHIHLSNNAGRGWDSHLPVGRDGVLPIDAFLADLTDGYRGSVSLELDLRPWMKDPRALRDLLVQQREYCHKHLAAGAPKHRARDGG